MSPDDMTYKTMTDARREQFAESIDMAAQILQATNPLPLNNIQNAKTSQQ